MLRRIGPAVVILCAFAALCTIAPTASAQDAATQKDQLDKRHDDLDGKIAADDRAISAADAAIAAKQSDLNHAQVLLELSADDYARAVDSRIEPARTRLQIAIDAYVRGDPRITSLLTDIVQMQTQGDELIQRTLYSAVVEDAESRLTAIDKQLRDIGARVQTEQAAMKGVQDQISAEQQKRQTAADDRQKLAAERADVERQIQDILSRAKFAPLTGTVGFESPDRPALVIKIDNIDAARPQLGFNQADVVFEEEVEGGLTRLAAVFQSRGSDPVGPVRSVRTSDVHIFAELNNPLFSSSGGNPGAREQLLASTLVDVGQSAYPDAYYRESRPPPHNLYTKTTDLWNAASGKGARPPTLFRFLPPGAPRPASAVGAGGVSIDFGSAHIDYDWNGTGWARKQNGRAHVDAKGVQAAPTNVIVQFTNYGISAADENSPEAIPTGTGDAWVFTGGYLVRGHWSRKSDTAVTTYTDDSGNTISLNPGTTWIELPRPNSATVH